MLNTFPSLLAFGLVAPFLLRITLGMIFIGFGYAKLTKQRAEKSLFFESIYLKPGTFFVCFFGLAEVVAGILLVIGLFTQIAAVFAAFISFAALIIKKKRPESFESSYSSLFILLVISISLLFSGAGFWAFDLPL